MNWFEKLIERRYFKVVGNLALYDRLTGVYNYNWFDLLGKNKYSNKDVYITVIDLNNFKKINDTKGHSYGNDLLRDVGIQLQCIPAIDPTADIVRYGGDEFVIFSQVDIGAKIEAQERKDDIFSFGTYHKDKYEGLTRAFEKADEKMYKCKANMKRRKDD